MIDTTVNSIVMTNTDTAGYMMVMVLGRLDAVIQDAVIAAGVVRLGLVSVLAGDRSMTAR